MKMSSSDRVVCGFSVRKVKAEERGCQVFDRRFAVRKLYAGMKKMR